MDAYNPTLLLWNRQSKLVLNLQELLRVRFQVVNQECFLIAELIEAVLPIIWEIHSHELSQLRDHKPSNLSLCFPMHHQFPNIFVTFELHLSSQFIDHVIIYHLALVLCRLS